jgi:hypothetical protein
MLVSFHSLFAVARSLSVAKPAMAPRARNGSSPRGTQKFVWREQISAWMLGQVRHKILSFFLLRWRLAEVMSRRACERRWNENLAVLR